MSCRFLFYLFLIIIQKCFASVHIPPNVNHLQYSFIRTESNQIIHRVKRHTKSDLFQIHIHYDTSIQKYFVF